MADRKTRLCTFWPSCHFATPDCKFAHGEGDLRIPGQNAQMPASQPGGHKTRMCHYYPNCKWAAPECKFAHGDDDLRTPINICHKLNNNTSSKPQLSKYKTDMCIFQKGERGCFHGRKCLYAHSEEERSIHIRVVHTFFRLQLRLSCIGKDYGMEPEPVNSLVNAINNREYKTKLCRHMNRAGGVCTYKEKCIYIHPGDPEYAAFKKSVDALWVPVAGDITRVIAFKTYADAVRSCAAVAQVKKNGPLPTHLPDGMTTEVVDMAVSNGCIKSHWIELCERITKGFEEIQSLDAQISRWNSNPCRERYSKKIADAKAERVGIENKLKQTVIEKNKYLNKDLVELHGFRHAQDAVKLVRMRLREIRNDPSILPVHSLRPRTLTLITGAGNRSARNPLILEAVFDFLETQFEPEMLNRGCILVPFQRSWLERK